MTFEEAKKLAEEHIVTEGWSLAGAREDEELWMFWSLPIGSGELEGGGRQMVINRKTGEVIDARKIKTFMHRFFSAKDMM